jgi:hypothetical protein
MSILSNKSDLICSKLVKDQLFNQINKKLILFILRSIDFLLLLINIEKELFISYQLVLNNVI